MARWFLVVGFLAFFQPDLRFMVPMGVIWHAWCFYCGPGGTLGRSWDDVFFGDSLGFWGGKLVRFGKFTFHGFWSIWNSCPSFWRLVYGKINIFQLLVSCLSCFFPNIIFYKIKNQKIPKFEHWKMKATVSEMSQILKKSNPEIWGSNLSEGCSRIFW